VAGVLVLLVGVLPAGTVRAEPDAAKREVNFVTKVFSTSPDGKVQVLTRRQVEADEPEDSRKWMEDGDVFVFRDKRNQGGEQLYEITDLASDYWVDWHSPTEVTLHWGDEKCWVHDFMVLRRDIRSGRYFFERPDLPVDKLVSYLVDHTNEYKGEYMEPDVLGRMPYADRFRVLKTDKTGTLFKIQYSTDHGSKDSCYHFEIFTPDWVRYDLRKISRTGVTNTNKALDPNRDTYDPLILYEKKE